MYWKHSMRKNTPPFDLIQLSKISKKYWEGLPVFHPNAQQNNTPQWLADEYSGPPIGTSCFDVGVVVRWEPDPDFEDLCIMRVFFICSNGVTLYYSASNLWVPRIQISKEMLKIHV